jgi:biotin operon repressor
MPRAQGPKVVDRSTLRRLDSSVAWGSGLEAVICLVVLSAGSPFDQFERGDEFAHFARAGMPAAVTDAIARLRARGADAWSGLLGLIASEPSPHSLATVIERLERSDPSAIQRAMTRPVAPVPAAELKRLVIAALRALPEELYLERDAETVLERNAADAARLLAEGEDSASAIEALTDGFIYRAEPGISAVLLIPTLVHRPWTLVLDHDGTKIVCYPARLATELSAADVALIGTYRALGDGNRLRILRRLAAGPASVGRISEEIGLAKSTVHEHLESLRTAGLVKVSASGFELEPELPDLNWMLKEFLGLEMRRQCEGCGISLDADGTAFICSYECTFCADCAEQRGHKCPNCGGELVHRPRRTKNPVARRRSVRPHRAELVRSAPIRP